MAGSQPDDAWRDPRRLMPYVVAALLLTIPAQVYMAAVERHRVAIARRVRPSPGGWHFAAARASDHDLRLALVLTFTTFFVAAVLWLLWFDRMSGDADLLRPVRHGRWAVLGWLLPLVNLVMPVLMMNDVWAAGDPDPTRRPRVTPLVPVWWVLVLLSGYVGFWSRPTRLADPDTVVPASMADATVRHVLSIAAALLACVLVVRATARLHARAVAVDLA